VVEGWIRSGRRILGDRSQFFCHHLTTWQQGGVKLVRLADGQMIGEGTEIFGRRLLYELPHGF